MAQTGYTPILIYSSSTGSNAPSAGNLTNSTLGSELAINITDGKLFYKDNSNNVQVIAWKVTPTTAGGTGLTSYTAGDTLYYASGTTLTKLAIGASKTIMTSSGTAPQWSTSLDTTQGGTGLTSYTAGDLVYYAAGTTFTKLAIGANTTILASNGTAPQWVSASSVSIGTATNLAGGAAGSVPYQSAANTTTFVSIGSAYQAFQVNAGGTAPTWQPSATSVLTSQGDLLYASSANTLARLGKNTSATRYLSNTGSNNNPDWAQINLTNGVTGTLPVGNGGTGTATTFTTGSVVFAGASGVYSQDNANFFWDDTNNYLGLGTASPSGLLHVAYNTNNTGWQYLANTNTGSSTRASLNLFTNSGGGDLRVEVNNSANTADVGASGVKIWNHANAVLSLGTNGTERARFVGAGNFQPGADNAYTCGANGARWSAIWAANGTIQTSDERQKNTIIDSDLGLQFINSLRPVSYKWNVGQNIISKDDNGNTVVTSRPGIRIHYGLIAQEVKNTLGDKDFGGFIHDVNSDEMGLRYDQFIAPMIKAIQELKAELDATKAKVIALEST